MMLSTGTDAWLMWRHRDGAAAQRLRRALSTGLALAIGVVGLLFVTELPALRGASLAVGAAATGVAAAVTAQLVCGWIRPASLVAFSCAALALGAVGPTSNGRSTLVAGTSMAICLAFGVVVIRAPRDIAFMLLMVSAYLVTQQAIGRDLLVSLDQSVLNVGIAFCVRPFLGLVLQSARRSDDMAAQTLAAEQRTRILALEDQGHHQARRILHDEVLAALRSVEHSGGDVDRVRRACKDAALAVRTGGSRQLESS